MSFGEPLSSSYKKRRSQLGFMNMKGLRSYPDLTVPPDCFITAQNFYHDTVYSIRQRPGQKYLWSDSAGSDSVSSDVEWINPSNDQTEFIYIRGSKVMVYNGSYNTYLNYSENSSFLSGNTTKQSLCVYNGKVYICDGTSYLYIYDGNTAVTRIQVPSTSDYGNPVDIFEKYSCLFTITDKNYLRYTASGFDDVWEQRTQLLGTVAITAGTKNITGTNTLFQVSQLGIGINILLVQGSTTEYFEIAANPSSNTALTTRLNAVNTFTNASVYIVGIQFAEPIGITDGLKLRKAQKFGDLIAISKTSDNITSNLSKLTVLKLSTTDTSIFSIAQQDISEGLDIHPYAMCEWSDTLMLATSNGLYAVSSSQFDSTSLKPVLISSGKLDNAFSEMSKNKKNNTKLKSLNTKEFKLLCLMHTYQDGDYNTKCYWGFEYKQFDFEFLSATFTTKTTLQDTKPERTTNFDYISIYNGELLLLTSPHVYQLTNTRQYDEVAYEIVSITLDSTEITLDSTEITLDAGTTAIYSFYNIAIDRYLRPGVISTDLFNFLALSKYFIVVEERLSQGVLNNNTYTAQLTVDGNIPVGKVDRKYLDGRSEDSGYNWASTEILFSNTDIKFSNSIVSLGVSRNLSFLSPARQVKYVSLTIFDISTDGALLFRGYGLSFKSSKY